jgi:molybdopterin synthase catalytic subunit
VTVEILNRAFDPWHHLAEYQNKGSQRAGQIGATAVFIGTMRDFNQDTSVQGMLLEHYPGMTENYLEKISREAVRRWDLMDSLIVHRVGELLPGEPIVLVAVWSAHRNAVVEKRAAPGGCPLGGKQYTGMKAVSVQEIGF